MIRIIMALMLVTASFSITLADDIPEGKRSRPGKLSPATAGIVMDRHSTHFVFGRDPFKEPTEILPTDCPPSMPLCKFDCSQLKVVGVIQLLEGSYKAFVEDPDGRGYSVVVGQMIGAATVTQISRAGLILRFHRKAQDVTLPMYQREKDS